MILGLLLPLVLGCRDGSVEVQVLTPDDVEVTWDQSFNRVDDGVGALVPVDVLVYEGVTGAPLEAVEVEVRVDDLALVFPHHEVVWLDDADDRISSDDARLDDTVTWDVWLDRWIELGPAGSSLTLTTDSDGLVRFYVYADAFEGTTTLGLAPLVVVVSTEANDETFALVPR